VGTAQHLHADNGETPILCNGHDLVQKSAQDGFRRIDGHKNAVHRPAFHSVLQDLGGVVAGDAQVAHQSCVFGFHECPQGSARPLDLLDILAGP
jgi:hypothetical protein